jgi:uncharacterized membrane protein
MDALQIALRWLHIVPAVVAGGGSVFLAVALLPALREMPADVRTSAREAITRRWRVVVMASITLLLASGAANFLVYQWPAHRGQASYEALFALKFLAAMVVFFIGSALTGRSAALQPMRDNIRFWAGLNASLVLLVVVLSGALRFIPGGR